MAWLPSDSSLVTCLSPEEARAASFLVAMAARYLIVEKGPQVGISDGHGHWKCWSWLVVVGGGWSWVQVLSSLRKELARKSLCHFLLKSLHFYWVVVSNDIFYFHPKNWGRWTHFDEYFPKGLVQPTSHSSILWELSTSSILFRCFLPRTNFWPLCCGGLTGTILWV